MYTISDFARLQARSRAQHALFGILQTATVSPNITGNRPACARVSNDLKINQVLGVR